MITVVIPLYNKATTIEAAVLSVQAQTHPHWQLIVVDDGSSDEGPNKVSALAEQDARILLVRQANAGVSAARNQGVRQAHGDCVAFLDADDVWLPGHLAQLVALHQAMPNAPMWATAYRLVDDSGMDRTVRLRPGCSGHHVINDYFAESVAFEFPVHSSAVMVSKRALLAVGGFPLGVGSGEDILTWARLSCMGGFPMGACATAVYVSPSVAPDLRHSVVRRPATPDRVADGLMRLQDEHQERAQSINLFLGLWWRIRAMSYLELNERLGCARSIMAAVSVAGWQMRDAQSLLLCLLPHGLRTRVLAHRRGWRPQKIAQVREGC